VVHKIVMISHPRSFLLAMHPETVRVDPVLVNLVVDHPLGCAQQFGGLALISQRTHERVDDEGPFIGVHETGKARDRLAFHFLYFHDFPPRLVIVE
jgi:hypothetical protein